MILWANERYCYPADVIAGTGRPGPAAEPLVSAIVCTRNRADSLERTLATFAALDLSGVPGFELVVVNNGSSDRTDAVMRRFAERAPFPVVSLKQPERGVSKARNMGIAASSGAIIIFTDDDCLIPPDHVATAVRLMGNDLMRMIGGRVELNNPDHLPLAVKTDPLPGRLTEASALIGFLHGANWMFGRTVIHRIGGFDERFGPGGFLQNGDDAELSYRGLIAGVPVLYEPALTVRHDHGRIDRADWYRQSRSYAVGAGALMMKHLLTGRVDVLRMNYWDMRSAIRRWRRGEESWRWIVAKLGIIEGAARYLIAARRPSGERFEC